MGTWTSVIVDTQGRADFWKVVRPHGVEPLVEAVPELALVLVQSGGDMGAPLQLAESLSTVLRGAAIGFCGQSAADAYEIRAYDRGDCARRLVYTRDDGGFTIVEGRPQPWEPAFFFGTAKPSADAREEPWPDVLADDISDDDLARYEAARRDRDPSRVMDLLRLSSLAPLRRLCAFYRVDPDAPAASWSKPSFFSRLFG